MNRNVVLCMVLSMLVLMCSCAGRDAADKASVEETGGAREAAAAGAETAKQAAPCPDNMALIKAGSFMMGCSADDTGCRENEQPRKEVTITKDFCIGKYEVTQNEYKKVMGEDPSKMAACGSDCPVDSVEWTDAVAYCEKTGGRLPTEAEWEYAARGGSDSRYYWDDGLIRKHAWIDMNSRVDYEVGIEYIGAGKHPVGQLEPNAFGLYDILGNMHEYTADCFAENWLEVMPAQDPASEGGDDCRFRTTKGGSWYFNDYALRVSARDGHPPDYGHVYLGFRCAADAR